MNEIDYPGYNDNRAYNYTHFPNQVRAEYSLIVDLVPPNATVVDLGCGNGSLLAQLIREKRVEGVGIEISPSGVAQCQAKGLTVYMRRIDQPLTEFPDQSFDVAICNVTLQMVLYPEVLFAEMKRLARTQIISFPNFAYFKNRLELLLHGRMPRHMLFGYTWYNTGHVHQLSLRDFEDLCQMAGLRPMRYLSLPTGNHLKGILARRWPNLFAVIIIAQLSGTW